MYRLRQPNPRGIGRSNLRGRSSDSSSGRQAVFPIISVTIVACPV